MDVASVAALAAACWSFGDSESAAQMRLVP